MLGHAALTSRRFENDDDDDDDDDGNESDEYRPAVAAPTDSGHTQHANSSSPRWCCSSNLLAEMRWRECSGEREEDRSSDDTDDGACPPPVGCHTAGAVGARRST